MGLTSSQLLNKYSIVDERPSFPQHLARKKGKRGYATRDGRILQVRTQWCREERKGHFRYVLYYFIEDLKRIADERARRAAEAAAEPYVDDRGRWHRLIRFPETHNLSYRCVTVRMNARKPREEAGL